MKVKGYSHRCYYCAKEERCTRDHFIPRSKGGKLTVWACQKCQDTKKDLMPLEWLGIIHTISEYEGKCERIKNSVLSLIEWMEINKQKLEKWQLLSKPETKP